MNKVLIIIAAASIILFLNYNKFSQFHAAGPFLAPKQVILEIPKKLMAPPSFEIMATHRYELTAMIMSKSRYWLDGPSKLSPVDFVLAWGPLTQKNYLSKINYSQWGRWYYFNYRDSDEFMINEEDITSNSANTHIIPDFSKPFLKKQILNFKEGQVVRLIGYLVTVTREGETLWQSSTVRSDTGAGACEVFYVTGAY